MAKLGSFFRTSNSVLCGYLNRISPPQCVYAANYSQSAEEKLGLKKPKKPVTVFLKFALQVRPTLKAKNPNVAATDLLKLASKHWQQLGDDTKKKMQLEYENEMEEYRKKKEAYEASLTTEQKENISKMQEEISQAKEKKKQKAEMKDLGRPKRPLSAYILFSMSLKDKIKDVGFKNFQSTISKMWNKLSQQEKSVWEEKAEKSRKNYRIELSKWEQEMLKLGHNRLVTKKGLMEEYAKTSA